MVNRAVPSLPGGSLEIMIIVSLRIIRTMILTPDIGVHQSSQS